MKKRLLILGAVSVCLLAAFAYFGSSLLGVALEAGVESVGSDVTLTEVELDEASVSLLSGQGTLSGLVIGNPEGFESPYAFRAQSVQVDLRPRTLMSDKIVIEDVFLESPECLLEASLGGTNFARIIENARAQRRPREAAAESASGARFEVRRIRIVGARVAVASESLAGSPVALELPPIEITDLGSGPEGVAISEILARVLDSLDRETLAALGQSEIDFGEALEGAAEQVKDKLGELLGGRGAAEGEAPD